MVWPMMNINFSRATLDVISKEDIGVVEGMQRGRRSSALDDGIPAPNVDKRSHHSPNWVAKQLTRAITRKNHEYS